MIKTILTLFIFLLPFERQMEEIYCGKSFSWKVYFDPNKVQLVVEIGGIKYGDFDYLKKEGETQTYFDSQGGELYKKGDCLHYKNENLKINIKLKKKPYTSDIDYQRQKIFEINAVNKISKLKDSLQVEYQLDSNFASTVKSDYIFYRDNVSIPENYSPKYIDAFYRSLK